MDPRAVVIGTQRQCRHRRPEIGAADADIDDVGERCRRSRRSSPARTASANAVIRSSSLRMPGMMSSPSTLNTASGPARRATCITALPSVVLIASPANIAARFSATPACSATATAKRRALRRRSCSWSSRGRALPPRPRIRSNRPRSSNSVPHRFCRRDAPMVSTSAGKRVSSAVISAILPSVRPLRRSPGRAGKEKRIVPEPRVKIEIEARRCRDPGRGQHLLGEVGRIVREPAHRGIDIECAINGVEIGRNRAPASVAAEADGWPHSRP